MNIAITGASRGIGKEIALNFASDSANMVLIFARDGNELRKIAESKGSNVRIIEGNLNKELEDPGRFRRKIEKHADHLDIVINNAGYLVRSDFDSLSRQQEDEMVLTNFLTPGRLIRALLPLLGSGSHVINIGSMSGYQGSQKYPGLTIYGATKSALASLTESLAVEYSEKKISFNCLAIGAVQTEMFELAFPGFRAPLKPDEMGEFIVWFALNGHKYFNGKVLPVAQTNPS